MMSVKAILILCAQALLVKTAVGQSCSSRAAVADISRFAAPYGLAAPGLAAPCGLASPAWANNGLAYAGAGLAGRGLAYDAIYAPAVEFSPTSGGALPVSSASAIAPVGISVASDNVYEGALSVIGELPFVGTVGLDGVVPSAGAGAVNHACGNGRNAMISENAAFAPAAAYAPLGAYGPAAGIAPAALGAYGSAALAAPGLGFRGGWAGRSCGCGL